MSQCAEGSLGVWGQQAFQGSWKPHRWILPCLHLRLVLLADSPLALAPPCPAPSIMLCWWSQDSPPLQELCSPSYRPLQGPLWPVFLWFPGGRVGRTSHFRRTPGSTWPTQEVGGAGGAESGGVEEGKPGLGQRWEELLDSWRTGRGLKAHEKETTH